MMNSDLFTLVQPTPISDLTRIGSDYDGGYFIKQSTIKQTKVLIGLGIFINWKFEEEFNKKNNQLKTYLVDASVSTTFYKYYIFRAIIKFVYHAIKQPFFLSFFFRKYILESLGLKRKWFQFHKHYSTIFLKKFLSNKNDNIHISAYNLFNTIKNDNELSENSIFVKMDIEGSEYDVLHDFEQYYFYINSFAIEFHEIGKNQQQFIRIILQLKQKFDIVFVHNNNYSKMFDHNFAESLEITFVKRSLIVEKAHLSIDYKSLFNNKITACNPTKIDNQPAF